MFLVQLVPRITYYPEEEIFLLARTTRTTLGLAGAIGTGTSVLVLQDQNYRALRVAIDVDIATLEKNLSPT